MRYCPNCGTEVDQRNRHCHNCGAPVDQRHTGNQQPSGPPPQNPPRQQAQQPQRESRQRQQQPQQASPRQRRTQRSSQQQSSRRSFLLGGGILAALGIAGGGAYFLFWNQTGPADVAEEFVDAIDEGNFSEANDLIHSQATVDGAGVASQILLGQVGVNVALEAIDISVSNSETVEENDDRALVRLTLNIDAGFGETEQDIQMAMRQEDGDWRVWSLGV